MPHARVGSLFADLRSVTAGWDCVSRGIHVATRHPCDPWGRSFVYPHLWLVPGHLGAGEGGTVPLGILLIVLFFGAALALLPRRGSWGLGLVYGAALCSPAVMLGVERANVELLVFALGVGAVLVLRRGTAGLMAAAALLVLATLLK